MDFSSSFITYLLIFLVSIVAVIVAVKLGALLRQKKNESVSFNNKSDNDIKDTVSGSKNK